MDDLKYHNCCQLSVWQEKDPLPRSRSGNPNQGGATEENNILEGLPMVERGSEMAPELLEFAQKLKNEARLHGIAIGNVIKKIDEVMSYVNNRRT